MNAESFQQRTLGVAKGAARAMASEVLLEECHPEESLFSRIAECSHGRKYAPEAAGEKAWRLGDVAASAEGSEPAVTYV